MGVVDRKLAALGRLKRLHAVRRRLGGDPELESVIAELEAEVGETVSQRCAARFLGVSHTALGRWTREGRVPLVENRVGRLEVPVPALLRLAADAGGERAPASAPRRTGADPGVSPADRSLAYHRAVAACLGRHHVEDARYRVRKWRAEGKLDPAYADAWEEVLSGSLAEIRKVLTEESEAADDLRQNSPFAGVFSEPDRRALIGAPSL
jgi:hypothetical protein